MRAHLGLWIGSALLIAPLARAGDDVRVSLTPDHLVIETGERAATIELACEQPYALARKGHYAFVACGLQGVAIYDLHEPLKPTFHGRFLYDNACVALNADAQCIEPLVVNRLPEPPRRDLALRNAGIGLVAIGGAAVLTGALVGFGQGFADLSASFKCFCSSSTGPPAAIGWAALATSLIGAGIGLVGIPLWISGAGVRVAF